MRIKLKTKPKDIMPTAGLKKSNPMGMIVPDTSSANDKCINSSIKPIKEEDANVEAELGEVLLQFDMGGLFDIKGKKHSKGGTPILANEKDFIFSDDDSLSFTENEKEIFGFKQKNKSVKKNTPAAILGSEVSSKEYNFLVSILKNPKSDDIAKKTAILMLGKYQNKIGQVAFVQESKKNFPDGIPSFSEGTAPVESEEIKNAKIKEKMFARLGGIISKEEGGKIRGYRGDRKDKSNATAYSDEQWTEFARDIGFKGNNIRDFQTYLFNMNGDSAAGKKYNFQEDIIALHEKYGNPKAPPSFNSMYNWLDGRLGHRWDAVYEKWKKSKQPLDRPTENTADDYFTDKPATLAAKIDADKPAIAKQVVNTPAPEASLRNLPSTPFEGYQFDMNSAEMASIAAPYLTALAQPTLYDMLIQKHSAPVRFDRASNEANEQAILSGSSLSRRELFSNSPARLAQLQSAAVDASATDSIVKSNFAVNQENRQTSNQETQTNDSKTTGDHLFNLGEIKKTFDNNTRATQYRNEQLANGFTDSLNNAFVVHKNLETLETNANTMAIPFLALKGVTEDGKIVDAKDPRAVRTIQVPPIGFSRNRSAISTGLGSLEAQAVNAFGNKIDTPSDYANMITEFAKLTGISDPFKAAQALGFYKQLMVKQGVNKTDNQ